MDFLQQPDSGLIHPLWETFFSPIPRQLCPCSNLLAPVLFLSAPLRRVCLLCGSWQVFEGKNSIPTAYSFLCCTTLGPCSAFSPSCQDCSCSRRSQMWTHGAPDEASPATEPRATILSLCSAATLVLRTCLASSTARIHSWLCSPCVLLGPSPVPAGLSLACSPSCASSALRFPAGDPCRALSDREGPCQEPLCRAGAFQQPPAASKLVSPERLLSAGPLVLWIRLLLQM